MFGFVNSGFVHGRCAVDILHRHKIICTDVICNDSARGNLVYAYKTGIVIIALKMAENSREENGFCMFALGILKVFSKSLLADVWRYLLVYCVTCAHVSSPDSVLLKQLCKLSSSINSPSLLTYTHIHTHQSPPPFLSHSRSDSIYLAQCAKAGFKIFPPPVQICSTLKWISLFHLSLGLTGK